LPFGAAFWESGSFWGRTRFHVTAPPIRTLKADWQRQWRVGAGLRRLACRSIKPQMQVDDKLLNLSAGMAVTVEIKTGTRRIIDLLSPILRHSEESLRER
jgi:hypothetical protein